jgi:hypothetical protein
MGFKRRENNELTPRKPSTSYQRVDLPLFFHKRATHAAHLHQIPFETHLLMVEEIPD